MAYCGSCGRELPEGALYCPVCGAKAADFTVAASGFSPSHFNSGITSTEGPVAPPGFAEQPYERKPATGRRRFVLFIVVMLAILLAGVAFEAGTLTLPSSPSGSSSPPGSWVLNSPSTPFTGQQLYSAFLSNQTSFDATYLNKTVYVQDTLDRDVAQLSGTGQYYSSINSGTVLLVWNNSSQVAQLPAGVLVMAECSVQGVPNQQSPAGQTQAKLFLQPCDLISVQSQTTTEQPAPIQNV